MNEKIGVLLVDDHQIVLDGVKSMLKDSSFAVIGEALNGHDALRLLEAHADVIQVIVSDISMPVMEGTELCRTIKKKFPDKKVLMLSMLFTQAVIQEVIDAEADGFVLKHIGRDEFLVALTKVCQNGTYYSGELLPILYASLQPNKSAQNKQNVLSSREREIVKLIVEEFTSEQIAEKLFISKKTVDNHRANILDKTKSHSTIGLVKFALQNGLI
jgi:DNA-binding NarL/FixJ family response regulator